MYNEGVEVQALRIILFHIPKNVSILIQKNIGRCATLPSRGKKLFDLIKQDSTLIHIIQTGAKGNAFSH